MTTSGRQGTLAGWTNRSRSPSRPLSHLALLWLAAAYARYRAVYRYADEDLDDARRDAVRRSRSVLGGRAGEQLVPLMPDFSERFDTGRVRFELLRLP